jgi:hypothetical protein
MFLDSVQPQRISIHHRAHDILVRGLAVALLLLSALAWLRLVGVFAEQGANWRFDTMAPQWQVALLLVAVVGPVAATGLWLLSSWGVALWLGLTIFQILIFTVLADRFESRPGFALFHGICIAAYVGVWISIFLHERARDL